MDSPPFQAMVVLLNPIEGQEAQKHHGKSQVVVIADCVEVDCVEARDPALAVGLYRARSKLAWLIAYSGEFGRPIRLNPAASPVQSGRLVRLGSSPSVEA